MRCLWLVLLSACAAPVTEDAWAPRIPTYLDRITDAMVDRHMAPLYRWLESTGAEPVSLKRRNHYALVIRPQERAWCSDVVFRFHLDFFREGYDSHHWSAKEPWIILEETPTRYAERKVAEIRAELKDRLVMAFAQESAAGIETFTHGTAMFCRMPTEHSDSAKIRPEDVIY